MQDNDLNRLGHRSLDEAFKAAGIGIDAPTTECPDPNAEVAFTLGCEQMGFSRRGFKAKWNAQQARKQRGEQFPEISLPTWHRKEERDYFHEFEIANYLSAVRALALKKEV
jgi:hypothetical protein